MSPASTNRARPGPGSPTGPYGYAGSRGNPARTAAWLRFRSLVAVSSVTGRSAASARSRARASREPGSSSSAVYRRRNSSDLAGSYRYQVRSSADGATSFRPGVQAGGVFAHPSRPDPVHLRASAIVFGGLIVDAANPDVSAHNVSPFSSPRAAAAMREPQMPSSRSLPRSCTAAAPGRIGPPPDPLARHQNEAASWLRPFPPHAVRRSRPRMCRVAAGRRGTPPRRVPPDGTQGSGRAEDLGVSKAGRVHGGEERE